MTNIHRNSYGKLCASYKGIEYEFESIIELMQAISIIKRSPLS
jgi:hypothetical protein